MPKHDFLLSYELEAVFDGFTDEQAGRLIKAIFDYEIRREVTEFGDPFLQMMFDTVIRPKSDANIKRYEETCQKLRQNAHTRWSRAKSKNAKHANESNCMQGYANDAIAYNECKGMQNMQTGVDNDIDKSLSIKGEDEKVVEDFFHLLGPRKISAGKKLKLLRLYKEAIKTKPKEDVERELLDYLSSDTE